MIVKLSQYIILFLFTTQATLAGQTAQVIMVKGEVTALKPGDRKASKVIKGQTLPEDTSVLTADKSVVRLKFADNSTMNLGPKSKVVVTKLPIKKPNMINLLTGAIKAEVNKKSNKETSNKMIIKTRSAVMGVRGTKFQAGFNPTNGNTSLVTVEGKVAMVKKDEIQKVVEKVELQIGKKKFSEKAIEKGTKKLVAVEANPEAELEALDKVLETSDKAVEVPAGRFSAVSEATSQDAPIAPTKIAPAQYNALAKSMNSDKKAEDVFTDKEIEEVARAASEVAGSAQKAGGFVDFETGIYVPPPADAKKDEKTGVFIAKDIGKVDEKTGDYIPPKGIKLDAKEGFVIDRKETAKLASNEDKEQLQKTLARLESVNKEVKKQVVINKMQAKSKQGTAWWKPKSHVLSAMLQPYSETVAVNNNQTNSEAEFFTKQANLAQINWEHNWNDKWTSHLALGKMTYKIDDKDVDVNERGGDDEIFDFGVDYNWSERLKLRFSYIDQAFYFVQPQNADAVSVSSRTFSYFRLGAQYFLWNWRSFQVYAAGSYMLFGDDKIDGFQGEQESLASSGLRADLIGVYEMGEKTGLRAGGFLERISHESDSFSWTRLDLGGSIVYFYNL